jgi:hypothetical protein
LYRDNKRDDGQRGSRRGGVPRRLRRNAHLYCASRRIHQTQGQDSSALFPDSPSTSSSMRSASQAAG